MSQEQRHISDYYLNLDDFTKVKNIKIYSDDIVATRKDSPNEKYIIHNLKMPAHSHLKHYFRSIERRTSLDHPAILPFTGFSCDNQEYSIIEPYMENGSLEKLIQDCAAGHEVPNFETTRSIIIFGIAAGMAYIHQKGITHLNLYSNTIFLDSENHPKIGGIKENFIEKYGMDMGDHVIPNCYYCSLSPEMIEAKKTTNRSDVFSYSAILYQMFMFKTLKSEKENLISYLDKIVAGKRIEIEEDKIPRKWADLIRQCWHNDMYERPSFIEIVAKFMDKKDEYFNDPKINQEELSRYIDAVTRGLDFSRL